MKNDRNLIIGFTIFAIFVVIVGFLKIKESIAGPFRVPEPQAAQPTSEELRQVLAKKDTDNDGLSDEDEIFKYHTSIYLEDSDSDGYNDKEEVEAGSDSLNPESTPFRKIAEKKKDVIVSPLKSKELSIEEIKDMLIKIGLPKVMLDQIDDQNLKRIYQETIEETGVDPQTISLQNLGQLDFSKTQLNQIDKQGFDYATLNAEQIRGLLLSAGADEKILNTIDDETLKKMFLEMMANKE